ncbi:MAG TPA: NAD-dependent epimerase/dehydratase family protein [Terrimicrobium sp.]|jgi:nucleoside-diphosphate-sugar epimerase
MKVFLSGGTGFIGSHFVNQAHQAGHEIMALRRSASSQPRVPLQRQPVWINKAMTELAADDFAACDVLVHLAAYSANVPYDTLPNCIHWNVQAPLAMFAAAFSAGVASYVVAGSCSEYGRSAERYPLIPPDAPLEPTGSYSASKAAASVAFHAWACEANTRLLILRIFHVFGEGEADSRFWPSLRRAALAGEDFPMTSGEQIRDFIPVEQAAGSFVKAIDRSDIVAGRPRVENIGTGQPQSLKQFAEHWWKVWGARGRLIFGAQPHRPDEMMRYVPKV